jgi:para-aminobenzoate synthetase component 1
LRLEGGRRELFVLDPVSVIVLSDQVLTPSSESTTLYKKKEWREFWATLPSLLAELPAAPVLPDCPFQGGLIGYLGYGPSPDRRGGFPLACLGLHPRFLEIDHDKRRVRLACLPGYETLSPAWQAVIRTAQVLGERDALPQAPTPFRLTSAFRPLTSPARYRESFARIQAWLRSGDCYQVNYTQCFRATCEGSGATAMDNLLAASQPAHAAWLSLPEGEVLSLSPELFLQVRDARITTRPIKGTAPRGPDAASDEVLRRELEASAKNRAENLMITDLLRHDVGRHAETGSVRVERLFAVETLPQVHHLVSTVTARLRPGAAVTDLIRDCFPGGSITGAPKKRAMEIIAELEDAPRSVYCGSIGFIGSNGDAELNIAIRTLLRVEDEIFAWAGGGIVADSECDSEYAECFHKIGALLRVLEAM